MPDLLNATKLSRGSLYSAFGDKHGIFLRALDRYIDQALARLDQDLHSGSNALAGLRACMDGYLARTCGAAGKRGCLVVATAMELAGHDRDVADQIGRFFKAMELQLTAAITRAQREKTIAADTDPALVAHLLMCLSEGLRVVHKVETDHQKSRAAISNLINRFAN